MAKLRCRVGDLVMVKVGDDAGLWGLIEDKASPEELSRFPDVHWYVRSLGSKFIVEDEQGVQRRDCQMLAADDELIPMRNRRGTDEMLVIAGRPQEMADACIDR